MKIKEEAEEKSDKDREGSYQNILYMYKEAQDGKYTMEQVEEMGLGTELVQYGWPYAVYGTDVRYLYYDVDADGTDELIITYYNDIIDIYGYDGERVRLSFSTPYRGITENHPDGMLNLTFSINASDFNSTWYKYDTALGDYFSVFERKYDDEHGDSFYTFCYYGLSNEEHDEIEKSYRETGYYPVWTGEWSDEIAEEEYEKLLPETSPIKLPEGESISDIILPDDYVPVLKNKTGSVNSTLSRDEMYEIADNLGGKVCAFEYRDYDHDGVSEAFAAIGKPDDMGGYLIDAIWFIAGDGTTTKMRTDFKDLAMYESNNSYYMDYAAEHKGFFYADIGGYGSGWLTLVFSVKESKPYPE